MIANAFKNCTLIDNDLLVFASGVSNSSETDTRMFAKEAALLTETLSVNRERKFVYFSSSPIDYIDSPYYGHKLAMEDLIRNSTDRYLVC